MDREKRFNDEQICFVEMKHDDHKLLTAYIFDEDITNELQTIFESDKKRSTLLTRDNWKKRRSFGRRFMGWLYHFLAPLI